VTRNTLGLASLLVIGLMAGITLYVGLTVPGDVMLPTHWNLAGEADDYKTKWTALMIPVLIASGISAFFYFAPSIEPRERNLERSRGLYVWGWIGILLLMLAVELVTVSAALGWGLRAYHVLTGAVGAMFILIGNQLGKSRSMYLIGIRTPWTLGSEEVWIKTHRLGGKLMVAGGIVMIVAAVLPIPSGVLATAFAVSIAIMLGIPVVYSYLLWRREKKAQPSE
jgi:uncharacterized membrane protein